MKLWTDRESWESPSRDDISSAILELALDDFAILAKSDEEFIQTMRFRDGYLLEIRSGSADEHFEAIPRDGRPRIAPSKPWWAFWLKPKELFLFDSNEIVRAFTDYLDGTDAPAFVEWNRIRI